MNTIIHIPPQLLTAIAEDDGRLRELGIEIGHLYTDYGFPIDMALERLNNTKSQKIAILSSAQNWLIQHRRNSAATEKALDRQRAVNREVMERFIKTNETGIY